MKKTLVIASAITCLLFAACTEDSHTKMKGKTPDSEVPMPVKTAFSSKYPGATDVEWDKEVEAGKTQYEVEFKFENHEREAVYDENGGLIRSKED